MIRLGVNIDHVATVRQARRAKEPDPVAAAALALLGGADGITIHLREDRRHIQDRDLRVLRETVPVGLNLEMACANEILRVAVETRPDQVTLVPEKRQELTTEGGLDVVGSYTIVEKTTHALRQADIVVALFIDPDLKQIDAARKLGVRAIEFHTGGYADAVTPAGSAKHLDQLSRAAAHAVEAGLHVHMGHGLNYLNVKPIVRIPGVEELNIGHSIVSRAVLVGMVQAVRDMKDAMTEHFPADPMHASNVPGYPRRQGKVRDVYDLGDRLIIVATDRISAFDWVLPTPIPDKGRVLTALTLFWLRWLKVPNHLLSAESADFPVEFRGPEFAGRTMLVRKTNVVPVECVVRGYLAGSGWKDYRRTGAVCGNPLPPGLRECEALPEPIFTPATKAETGHDENISFDQMVVAVGRETAEELRAKSLDVYRRAAEYARDRGVIIADTKFEWGRLPSGELILIDEVLTPDSSRFWPADGYRPGHGQPSFDKQFVRDWLESTTWDKNSPPPELPHDVVSKTREKYLEAVERLTGSPLSHF